MKKNNNILEEISDKQIYVSDKNKISDKYEQKKDASKIIPNDSWQSVPHKPLLKRKLTTGRKINKINIENKKTTSMKQFKNFIDKIKIEKKPLLKRKAKQFDTAKYTVQQIVKTTLIDYNSIKFSLKAKVD